MREKERFEKGKRESLERLCEKGRERNYRIERRLCVCERERERGKLRVERAL